MDLMTSDEVAAKEKKELADAKTVKEFITALDANWDKLESKFHKPYGRIALEVAIPTAITVVGIFAVTAAVVFIDRRVGTCSCREEPKV